MVKIDSGAMICASIVLLSLIVPAAIFVGRNNVRSTRGKLVNDLAKLFSFAKAQGGTPLIVPAFELVKYKYDASSDPIRTRSWAVPVLIYVMMSTLGFMTAFGGMADMGLDQIDNAFLTVGHKGVDVAELIGVLTYTFLGGYIWTIQYLVRRVANFDLKPLSFLQCATHIMFGSFVTAAAWHLGKSYVPGGFQVLAPVAFLIGMFPTLMVDRLLAQFSFLQMRRVSAETRAICEELPLDTVLGIDPYIKFRLSEFEIEDIQNLATTNPIQLFVETPYGLYESIDWVAQAQLILAVGSKKTLQLRQINVRTIFDLEKALFNPLLRRSLVTILYPDLTPQQIDTAVEAGPFLGTQSNPGNAPWLAGDPQPGSSEIVLDQRDVVQALVAVARDDLHVMRLRQIWDVMQDRLQKRPYVKPALDIGKFDAVPLSKPSGRNGHRKSSGSSPSPLPFRGPQPPRGGDRPETAVG